MNQNVIIGGIALLAVIIAAIILFALPSNNPATEPTPNPTGVAATPSRSPLATPSPTPTLTPTPAASLTPSPSGSPLTSPTASPVTTGSATGTVKSFTLAASNFKYDIGQLRVRQGDTVRITLTNSGTMSHDWRLDEFKAATKVIATGKTDTVEFVADKKGTYEYYCSVGQHRQLGMVGQLIVE